MATADQIKSLIRAHSDQDNDRFKTTALQISAYEARLGHAQLARDIKTLIEKAGAARTNVLQFNNQNQMLLMSMPDNRLSDLVVSEETLERIDRILTEYLNRKKLQAHGMTNRRKILIEGAPGTGKTMTASIIASELHLPLYTVQVDKLVTKFMGETSVKLRQIFDSIESIMGVYFFDEFDAIGADRGIDNEVGEMRRILNSFLQFIEQDRSESIIIAATNNRRILDKALYRRFDDVLHYSMPSEADVRKLFQVKLGVFSPGFVPTDDLVEKAVSLSHAEISRVCDDAIKNSILNSNQIEQVDLFRLVHERLVVYEKATL
jgi:SpoVK/Ycf46/Vps4 family AAA+-type ATPase